MPSGVYDRTKSKPNMGEFGKRPPWNKGLNGVYSKEYRQKIAVACKKLNPAFKGGRIKNERGYVQILMHDHPFNKRGYVREHRLVVEKQIGRYLLPKEAVHHRGKKYDNRPHMLMAFSSQRAHNRFERGCVIKSEEIIFDGRKEQCV